VSRPTHSITADQVVTVVNEVLGAVRTDFEDINADTPLASLDLASVDVVEIVMRLEDMVGMELDVRSLERLTVIGDLAAIRPWGGSD